MQIELNKPHQGLQSLVAACSDHSTLKDSWKSFSLLYQPSTRWKGMERVWWTGLKHMLRLWESSILWLMLITTPLNISESKASPSICKCLKLSGRVTSRTIAAQPWCNARSTKAQTTKTSQIRSKARETLWSRKSTNWSTEGFMMPWCSRARKKTLSFRRSRDFFNQVGPRVTTRLPKAPKRKASKSSVTTSSKRCTTTKTPGLSDNQ